MALLPAIIAMVCVGPPLFVSPDGLRPALPMTLAPGLKALPTGKLPNRLLWNCGSRRCRCNRRTRAECGGAGAGVPIVGEQRVIRFDGPAGLEDAALI